MNKQTKYKWTHKHRKQTGACHGVEGTGEIEWEKKVQTSNYKISKSWG